MLDTEPTSAQPVVRAPKRPYVAPALVVHGDVRSLTLGKSGPNQDNDGGGSFDPLAADDGGQQA